MRFEATLKAIVAALPWVGYNLLGWSFETAVMFYCWLITLTVLEQVGRSSDNKGADE